MAEPTSVIAGDTWTWTRPGCSAYPATDGWILTYYLAQGAEAPKAVQASADGTGFVVSVAASITKDWTPGTWKWFARVAKGDDAHTLASGTLLVQPDPSATVDRRTHAEKCLAAIKAVLEKRMGDSIVEYEIDGVKAKHIPHEQLHALRDRLRLEVSLQRRRPVISRITLGGVR